MVSPDEWATWYCVDCGAFYSRSDVRKLKKRRICRCGASDWLSHFATYPPDLVRPCILASTSERGNCPECGAPWARVIDYQSHYSKREPAHQPNNVPTKVDSSGWSNPTSQTLGWRPTCRCNAGEPVPAVVLDPFVGSGTTAIVAKELGRRSIGIDLAEDYLRLAQYRIERTPEPLPMELPPVTMGPKPELAPVKTKLPNVLDGQEALL